MKFIEMTGKMLLEVVTEGELFDEQELRSSGVSNDSIVRVNEHGDIEVRRSHDWDVIGGLLGNYDERVRRKTGLDWA